MICKTINVCEGKLCRFEDGEFTVFKKERFGLWVEKKTTMNSFKVLSEGGKKELFLRWKHGFSNPETNDSLERTNKNLYYRWKDMESQNWENVSESAKDFLKKRIVFEEYSRKIWENIENEYYDMI